MMKVFFYILIFFGCSFKSFSQETLIGNWHRVNPSLKNQDLKSNQLQQDDLQIFEDSTFHIQGDTTTQNSSVSGWHIGEDYKGKIEVKGKDYLVLWTDPKDKIGLTLKIVELTKEKLIVKIGNIGQDIIYVRF
jgi:hypothetical protein